MNKIHLLILATVLVGLVGCARPETVITQLYPKPNTCQTDTARPDYLSNSTFTNCWGPNGEHMGLLGGNGTTVGTVMMGNLGGVVRGAAVLGAAIGTVDASN